jgi:pimeloyl-ACP methyl ester carboxylesterase
MKRLLPTARGLVKFICLPVLVALGILTSYQSKLIYFPRPYEPADVSKWEHEPGGKVIDYQTSDGKQRAYLLSRSENPERLWIVCGGNGTLALDWSDWLRDHGPSRDAWLLVDIPGYGACEGTPSPWAIRRSLKAVVPAATAVLHWSESDAKERLRFFGHSLGGGVCLMAAKEFDIRKGVILAPFTSTMDMTREVLGVPVGFMLWHRFDNEARLKEISARGNGHVFILHGINDEIIPIGMSRTLAGEFPSLVRLTEIPGGRHNTLQEIAIPQIADALAKARE